MVEGCGSSLCHVEDRVAKASKAFGALRKPVFADTALSLKTKRIVYKAVVLGVLLYGVETLTLKRVHSRKLEVFHNRCLRAILGITWARQRMERITSVKVREMIGTPESLRD